MSLVVGAVLAAVVLFNSNFFATDAIAATPEPAETAEVAAQASDTEEAAAMVFQAQTLKGEVVDLADQLSLIHI